MSPVSRRRALLASVSPTAWYRFIARVLVLTLITSGVLLPPLLGTAQAAGSVWPLSAIGHSRHWWPPPQVIGRKRRGC